LSETKCQAQSAKENKSLDKTLFFSGQPRSFALFGLHFILFFDSMKGDCMKNTDNNRSKQAENQIWKGATVGAILAGSTAAALTNDGKRQNGRFRSFLASRKWFVCAVVFLVVCVLATSFLLVGQFDQYLYRKEHDIEIDLLSEPGFEMDDGSGNMVFSTTSVDSLFQASYTGGEDSNVTVLSSKGDDVIAPGTQGEYTFRLKNTEDVELYYSFVIDGLLSVENSEHLIPVQVRLKGAEGDYLIGSDDAWEDIVNLHDISDAGTLKGNSSRYYTLEWQWPFERGNDVFDTMLGNGELTLDGSPDATFGQEINFSLQIETFSMLPVEDRTPFTIFFDRALPVLLIVSLCLLLFTLVAVIKYRTTDKRAKS
jgi:hypothetical protein